MKKILPLVALVASFGIVLTACDSNISSSSDGGEVITTTTTDDPTTTTSDTSTTEDPTTSQEDPIVTSYTVSTSIGAGASVAFITESLDEDANVFEAGSTVQFIVSTTDDLAVIEDVSITDSFIVEDNGVYSFVMPNVDTTLSVITSSLGDGSLLAINDVVESDLPEDTLESVVSKLEAAALVEGVYAKSAVIDSDYSYSSAAQSYYEYVAGNNDIIIVTGRTLSYSTSAINTYTFEQRGLYDEGHYYSLTGTTSTYSSTYTLSPSFQIVVDDPEEGETVSLSSNQILASEAKENASSFGIIEGTLIPRFFRNNVFGDNYSLGSNYTISSSIDAGGKTFTTIVSGTYAGSYYYYTGTMELNFDGNGFLNYAHFRYTGYSASDYDPNLGLAEGAEPTSDTSFALDYTRGYKTYVEPVEDITRFAANDYDVNITQSITGVSGSFTSDGNTVENGATLSFTFRVNDNTPWTINPGILVGGTEGFVELNTSGGCTITNEGEFELYFDNGIGDIKTVALTATPASPRSISFSLSNNTQVYAETTTNLTVSVLPVSADQSVTLEVAETSAVQATIAQNDDGSFSVTPATAGTLRLTATSTVDTTVTGSLTLTVVEKPNYNEVLDTLSTYSLYSRAWSENNYATFYDDGTGYYWIESSYGYANVRNPITFTWSLDEDTLEFTITWDDPEATTYYSTSYWMTGFTEFAASTSTTFTATYHGVYASSGNTATGSMSWSTTDRVDIRSILAGE